MDIKTPPKKEISTSQLAKVFGWSDSTARNRIRKAPGARLLIIKGKTVWVAPVDYFITMVDDEMERLEHRKNTLESL